MYACTVVLFLIILIIGYIVIIAPVVHEIDIEVEKQSESESQT